MFRPILQHQVTRNETVAGLFLYFKHTGGQRTDGMRGAGITLGTQGAAETTQQKYLPRKMKDGGFIQVPAAKMQPWLPFKKADGTVIRRYFGQKPTKTITVNSNGGTVGTKTFSSLKQLQQNIALPGMYADNSVWFVTVAELLEQNEISNEQAWQIARLPMTQVRGADGKTVYVPDTKMYGVKGASVNSMDNIEMGFSQSVGQNAENPNQAIFDALNKAVEQNTESYSVDEVQKRTRINETERIEIENRINGFVSGDIDFVDVVEDYAKLYAEIINSNKQWKWTKNISGGEH